MEKTVTPARTRMAPSPTGELHIGSLRTLLYDYALAKKTGGQFILRIEDTDQKRYVEGSEERLMQTVRDYGITWDEGPDVGGNFGPYVQTERLPLYKKYIQELLDKGQAYYCFCTPERLDELRATQKAAGKVPKYDKHCLNLTKDEIEEKIKAGVPYTIRLNVPKNETILFNDLIRGDVKFNSNDVDDQVLIKSNGIPTYHFAVVVDDHLMKITHVFRGEEWLPSVPKHVLLYRYFGWEMPKTAHLTVLLDPEGRGKMSKRHGSTHAKAFLDEGYLPEAVLNFLMLLGWNPGDEEEVISLEEFINKFEVDHLNKKPVAFDRKKLDYFNGVYIRKKNDEELTSLLVPFLPQLSKDVIAKFVPLIKERITKLSDASSLLRFAYDEVDFDKELMLQKGVDEETAKGFLKGSIELLKNETSWEIEAIQKNLLEMITKNNWHTGKFFMVFRVAIAGAPITPPIVESLPIIGKEKTIRRLEQALSKL